MAACVAVGIVIGWWLRATGGPQPIIRAFVPPIASPVATKGKPAEVPVATSGPGVTSAPKGVTSGPVISAPPKGAEPGGPIDVLRQRHLRVPIDGVDPETFKGGFEEHRTGSGGHGHDAVDILAPRNTPIHAIEDGSIAKFFDSKAGGHTIYQFDSSGRFAYYYAHLERYASGLREGDRVSAGDVLGYVGTSGNAPPGTPHLHFAIFELGPDKRWWHGEALDPYLAFRR